MTRLLFRGISTSKLTPDFDVVAMRGRAASLLISGQELHKVLMISCFFFFLLWQTYFVIFNSCEECSAALL